MNKTYHDQESYQRERIAELETKCDDARSCARYLLSFLVNEPHHLAVAMKRWPWLETMEPLA